MKHPVVDLSECILCGVCIEVEPDVFQMNEVGYIEVVAMDRYPEKAVDEAIKNCPVDCIHWQDA